MVVDPTLAHRNGASSDVSSNGFDVAHFVEVGGVVRVDAGGVIDELRMRGRNAGSAVSGGNGLSDGHDARRTSIARARDDIIAVDIERSVREVSVAIDVAHTSEHRRENRGGVVCQWSATARPFGLAIARGALACRKLGS